MQAFYEYQSMMAELLEIEVVNESMYDWASALGEAALMCNRLNKKKKFLVPEIIHPDRYSTLTAYTKNVGIEIEKVKYTEQTGKLDLSDLRSKLDGEVSAVYLENPSYLGVIEDQVDEVSSLCQGRDSLFVVGVDPTSLGIIKPPGLYGADIVIGEGQPFGSPLNFGGPLLGIFGCRDDKKMIRQLPGRLIGMTTTVDGEERGFVMTLTSREQHIKREKATSNICTNEGLLTVAAAIYMSSLGKKGIVKLGQNIFYNTQYLIKRIKSVSKLSCPLFNSVHFKEFTVNLDGVGLSCEELQKRLLEKGLIVGKSLEKDFPALGKTMLLCTTEAHLKKDLDYLTDSLREVAGID